MAVGFSLLCPDVRSVAVAIGFRAVAHHHRRFGAAEFDSIPAFAGKVRCRFEVILWSSRFLHVVEDFILLLPLGERNRNSPSHRR